MFSECVNTHFGINCSGACGHCKLTSDRICDIISGECLHGCKTGYNGRRCDEGEVYR
ncbi:hypothetical protein DPMN_082725 [Dreissena polymorpha]|uniref:Uncharacterized protein n=1 Tax=Dreissena polymorpha TaxID=45954 RepID=A0A9D3Y7H5_DREPO|nr:hypothetical protein DPMN_082725 [Dreissena polymorpha]